MSDTILTKCPVAFRQAILDAAREKGWDRTMTAAYEKESSLMYLDKVLGYVGVCEDGSPYAHEGTVVTLEYFLSVLATPKSARLDFCNDFQFEVSPSGCISFRCPPGEWQVLTPTQSKQLIETYKKLNE